jgi:hypothetical protein
LIALHAKGESATMRFVESSRVRDTFQLKPP